jgi:hypothetical protein
MRAYIRRHPPKLTTIRGAHQHAFCRRTSLRPLANRGLPVRLGRDTPCVGQWREPRASVSRGAPRAHLNLGRTSTSGQPFEVGGDGEGLSDDASSGRRCAVAAIAHNPQPRVVPRADLGRPCADVGLGKWPSAGICKIWPGKLPSGRNLESPRSSISALLAGAPSKSVAAARSLDILQDRRVGLIRGTEDAAHGADRDGGEARRRIARHSNSWVQVGRCHPKSRGTSHRSALTCSKNAWSTLGRPFNARRSYRPWIPHSMNRRAVFTTVGTAVPWPCAAWFRDSLMPSFATIRNRSAVAGSPVFRPSRTSRRRATRPSRGILSKEGPLLHEVFANLTIEGSALLFNSLPPDPPLDPESRAVI